MKLAIDRKKMEAAMREFTRKGIDRITPESVLMLVVRSVVIVTEDVEGDYAP